MMKSTIVGKDAIETAVVHQRSQLNQLALKHSADLNKLVSFNCGPLRHPSSGSLPLPVIP